MKQQYVDDVGAELVETLRSYDDDPSVGGVAVLAAEKSDPRPAVLDPVLRGLSTAVFGGVFPELLFEGEKFERGAVVIGFGVVPQVTTVSGLDDPEGEIGSALPDHDVGHGRASAFVFVDAFATRAEEFVRSLFERYGVDVAVVGGGAGSLSMEQRPCLFTGDGLVASAGQFALVETRTSVGVRHGWTAIGGPLRVTEADGQTLSSLDDEPAFDVYRRIVEKDTGERVTTEEFFETAKSHPFGISRLSGEMIVRDPYAVTADGSLRCFGNVPEGEFVRVLKGDGRSLVGAAAAAYDDAIQQSRSDEAENEAAPDAGGPVLCFDCISRVLYLGDRFDEEVDALGGVDEPTVGALTIGEIANEGEGHLDYYNKTVVVARMEGI